MHRRKFNLELWKEIFRNHVAAFTDYGNIKVLDFKAPDNVYRIRFLFEEGDCRLHITGDLSEFYNSLAALTKEDAYEIVKNIGREETDILDIYMLAFKLAKKQLRRQ